MADNTFQTVTEAQASPATREIYADIKSTMGVALVNLIWRHLAVVPSVLEWSWQTLKPYYASDAIPTAAWLLREKQEHLVLAQLADQEWAQLNNEIEDPDTLDAVLRTYERGNAQNLVAMCYLQTLIDGVRATDMHNSAMPELSTRQRNAQMADRVEITIPALPAWDDLSIVIQNRILEMSSVWVPAKYRGVTPSVFRHLAHWPETLGLYHKRVCKLPHNSDDRLNLLTHQAIETAVSYAKQLSPTDETLPMLTKADRQWLHKALDLFVNGMIAPGVVIVPAMRAVIDKDN